MPGFGDKLKRARESRDTPLTDVARRTRIGIRYLEALERGDFDGLPGRSGFGKLYIRVYAELFGFDPDPVISEYDRERLEHDLSAGADSSAGTDHPRKVRFVPRARRSSSPERRTQAPEPAAPSGDPPDGGAVASAESVISDAGPDPGVAPAGPPAPPEAATRPSMTHAPPSWRRRLAGVAAVLAALGAFGVITKIVSSRPVDHPVAGQSAATGSVTPPAGPRHGGADPGTGEDPMRPPDTQVPHDSPGPAAAPAAVKPRPADTRRLEVDEFDLGAGVSSHRVVDARRDFEEGTVAVFLTRVRGGAAGQTVYHVWIREGRLVQRIGLQVGSHDWRTHSRKTLWGAGDWTVEARDESGRVLARIGFRCLPAVGRPSGS